MIRRVFASLVVVLCASVCAASAAEPPGSIRRDTYGIPHILATTEPEAAFLHGYAAAEDHLALMARLYLRAQSRQSEFLGPDFVEEDVFFKQLEIQERAAHALASLPPLMRQIVERYADGYNAFLHKSGAQAPPYARPIQAVDVLAHCYAVLMGDFSLVPRPDRIAATEASTPAAAASNMWLLGGHKTASGHGMLLANPHLRWEGAFTLHEVHIRVPGQIDVYGVAFVGTPVVSIGFNPMLGWSHTVNQVDVTDIYRLTLDEAKTSYRYDDAWRPLQSRTVTIRVQTKDGLREEPRVLWRSHHGPVMRIAGSMAYAMKTAIGDDGRFLVQWHDMARARSVEEFRAALDVQGLPTFNVGYADRDGHVYFLAGGRVPIRPPGYEWSGVVPGDTSRTEWNSIHPNSELPQKLDPKSGYLQNANEPPWSVNRAEPIAAATYPKYMTAGALSARAQANLDLLESRAQFTLDDIIQAKFNATSFVAAGVKAELIAALRAASNAERFKPALATLDAWDGAMSATSRGAVLFVAWWEDYSKKAKPVFAGPPGAPHLGDAAQATRSMESAIDQLTQRALPLETAWGDIYRFQRGTVDLPMSGCAFVLGCVRAMMFRPGAGGKQAAYFGDTFVLAVEFDKTPRAYGVLAYSESSNPASPHFNDQAQLFASDRLRPIWFSEAQINAHQRSMEQIPDEVTNVRRQP
jgi:acyl-homoserine-lactone acylase